MRLPLSRLPAPDDCASPENPGPYESAGTYVKLTISFAHLQKLCPRKDDAAAEQLESALAQARRRDPPPPTPEQEFRQAAVMALALLGREYCELSLELGLITQQPCGPLKKGDEHVLLGPLGFQDVVERIMGGLLPEDGAPAGEPGSDEAPSTVQNAKFQQLVAVMRPAILKLVRSHVVEYGRDMLPCSGLYGDER